MERFAKIVNGFKTLTIFAKCPILDVCRVLNMPMNMETTKQDNSNKLKIFPFA